VFARGNVFTIEPGFYGRKFGARYEDDFFLC